MTTSHRGVKRSATYVRREIREVLDRLSKADLMEIAYDLAISSVGEDAGEQAAFVEIRDRAETLANYGHCTGAKRVFKNVPRNFLEGL